MREALPSHGSVANLCVKRTHFATGWHPAHDSGFAMADGAQKETARGWPAPSLINCFGWVCDYERDAMTELIGLRILGSTCDVHRASPRSAISARSFSIGSF